MTVSNASVSTLQSGIAGEGTPEFLFLYVARLVHVMSTNQFG